MMYYVLYVAIRTHGRPKNHVSSYVYIPYLVLITLLARIRALRVRVRYFYAGHFREANNLPGIICCSLPQNRGYYLIDRIVTS